MVTICRGQWHEKVCKWPFGRKFDITVVHDWYLPFHLILFYAIAGAKFYLLDRNALLLGIPNLLL